jgi:hypothetical protein
MLKNKPTIESETLLTLSGDLYEITPTTESNGNWIKVSVKKYKEHQCLSELINEENIEFEIDGWIEIVQDDGEPNLWHYARGC